MSTPESIPEDKQESHPCDCGGSVTKNNFGHWACDSCDFYKIVPSQEQK